MHKIVQLGIIENCFITIINLTTLVTNYLNSSYQYLLDGLVELNLLAET